MRKFIFLFLFFPLFTHARLRIVINQTGAQKIVVALPAFVTENGKPTAKGREFTQKMQDLLDLTGMFLVMGDSLLPQTDHDIRQIEFKKWNQLEVGFLIKGIVTSSKEMVELNIYDVSLQKRLGTMFVSLSSKESLNRWREVTDKMMGLMTGSDGPFHSQIVASCGSPMKRRLQVFSMDGETRYSTGKGLNMMSPAWHPDGKGLAYISFATGAPEAYYNGQRLTYFESTTITPAFTPDGKKILVASGVSGDTELYLFNISGKKLKKLTKSPRIDFNPVVGPNGEVVFVSERSGGLQLFKTDLDGQGVVQLTYTGFQNDQPDISFDGRRLAFVGRDQGAFDIFIMDADGTGIQRVTRDDGNNESPTFSPDGRFLAYVNDAGGIFITHVDGHKTFTLEGTKNCINLDWGPRLK